MEQAQNSMIFIVGPTATGKTKLAFELAKKLNADILSADSRQIYKTLSITTGADLPENFSLASDKVGEYEYHTDGQLSFYGVNFLQPDQEWSIAHFRDFAELVWEKTVARKRKLIIVGGSGLYHHSLFLDKNVLHIQRSNPLREELGELSVEQLQERLLTQYPDARTMLNNSDWQNSRRLIRWIEKTSAKPKIKESEEDSIFGTEADHNWIGLSCDKEILELKIKERVATRIDSGAIKEVELLLSTFEGQKLASFSTLGVKDIAMFINDQISKEELLELWSRHEFQYAKRQMTWFKKREYIKWVEVEGMFTSSLIDDILK